MAPCCSKLVQACFMHEQLLTLTQSSWKWEAHPSFLRQCSKKYIFLSSNCLSNALPNIWNKLLVSMFFSTYITQDSVRRHKLNYSFVISLIKTSKHLGWIFSGTQLHPFCTMEVPQRQRESLLWVEKKSMPLPPAAPPLPCAYGISLCIFHISHFCHCHLHAACMDSWLNTFSGLLSQFCCCFACFLLFETTSSRLHVQNLFLHVPITRQHPSV